MKPDVVYRIPAHSELAEKLYHLYENNNGKPGGTIGEFIFLSNDDIFLRVASVNGWRALLVGIALGGVFAHWKRWIREWRP